MDSNSHVTAGCVSFVVPGGLMFMFVSFLFFVCVSVMCLKCSHNMFSHSPSPSRSPSLVLSFSFLCSFFSFSLLLKATLPLRQVQQRMEVTILKQQLATAKQIIYVSYFVLLGQRNKQWFVLARKDKVSIVIYMV